MVENELEKTSALPLNLAMYEINNKSINKYLGVHCPNIGELIREQCLQELCTQLCYMEHWFGTMRQKKLRGRGPVKNTNWPGGRF